MASVLAFIPDLLFGSQVQGSLRAGGHEVELATDEAGVRRAVPSADVLVVDLTDEITRRVALLEALSRSGVLTGVRTLAFYAHVEAETRHAAERAGFDLVVPRSRMSREGVALITRLATLRT